MTHFIRLITNEQNNTATANFAAAVATNTDINLYESDNEYSYMDLAEYNTPEGSVVEITLSEELSDDQLDKIVEQITLEDYEIQASLLREYDEVSDIISSRDEVIVWKADDYKGVDLDAPYWETNGKKAKVDTDKLISNEPDKETISSASKAIQYFKEVFSSIGKIVDGEKVVDPTIENPILVTPQGSGYLVLDGNHRYFGAKDAGYESVNVRVIPKANVTVKTEAPPKGEQKQHIYKEEKITEATNEKLVVIYPGRFHPFHKGHANVFKTLTQQYGATADVYIATSGKQEPGKSPFSFEEKREMIATTGVNPNVVVRTKSPYQAEEITNQYDLNNTVVLYAVSEKDMAEDPRFNFPTKGPNLKKDLQPAHMQRWNGWDDAKSLADHSYVTTVPTITFNVMGEPATSATEIRQRFPNLSRDQQKTFINDLFGNYSDSVLNIMRNKLGDNNEHE